MRTLKQGFTRWNPMTVASGATALDRYCGARNRAGAPCRRPAGWGTDHAGSGRCKLHGGATPIRHGRYSVIQSERIRGLVEHFEETDDPLNTLPELALLRGLAADYINRYEEYSAGLLAWHASFQATQRPISQEKEVAFRQVVEEYEIYLEEHELEDERGDVLKQAREFINALADTSGQPKPVRILDIADAANIADKITKAVERVQRAEAANAISRKNFLRVMMEMGRAVDLHNDEPDPGKRLERIRNAWAGIRLG